MVVRNVFAENLLEDDETFYGAEGYWWTIVKHSPTKDETAISEGELSEDGVEQWITEKPQRPSPGTDPDNVLRIFWFRWPESEGFHHGRIPSSKAAFTAVLKAWKLSSHVVTALFNTRGVPVSLREPYLGGDVVRLGLAISHLECLFVFVHDIGSNETCVVMSSGHSWRNSFLSDLEASGNAVGIPTLVPLLVIEDEVFFLGRMTNGILNELDETRNAVGLNPWNLDVRYDDGVNLKMQMEALTNVAQKVAQYRQYAREDTEFVDAIVAIHDEYRDRHPKGLSAIALSDWEDVRQRLDISRARLQRLYHQSDVQQAIIQAQISTIYSMAASQDNQLSYKAAQASVRLSEVAVKDSADMRVIAAVTLLFLPATFVATLFSTSFFNFAPQTPTTLVSHWVWLYWVVTAGLTILVQAAWSLTSRQMKARHSALVAEKDTVQRELKKSMKSGSSSSVARPHSRPHSRDSLSASGISLRSMRTRSQRVRTGDSMA